MMAIVDLPIRPELIRQRGLSDFCQTRAVEPCEDRDVAVNAQPLETRKRNPRCRIRLRLKTHFSSLLMPML